MRLAPVLAALLVGAPAVAETLEPTQGYFIGCDAEGSPIFCYVNAAGFNWAIAQSGTVPELFDQLQTLPFLEPVIITGDYAALDDSSADLVLTGLEQPGEEDINIGNLRAMQGKWKPVGEENPFAVEIIGMDWLELINDTLETSNMMSVGLTCADGVEPGGMAINLYRYGDDPGADACWQMEYIDDNTMTLRDFMGDQGQVEFTRLSD